jgi:hypothetical protein
MYREQAFVLELFKRRGTPFATAFRALPLFAALAAGCESGVL